MDMTESIAPRSDQINSEDLLTGPRTFTVKEVRVGSAEQPIDIELVEFPGRPWRPSKTSRRVLVAGWGKESDVYPGRRVTLYRDPSVRFGKDEVGGIKVAAMSHLGKPLKLALTVTRGKKAPYVVEPLPNDAPATAPIPEGRIAPGRLTAIVAGLDALGISSKADKLDAVMAAVGRDLKSAQDLTSDEGATVLAWIELQQDRQKDTVLLTEDQGEPLWPDVAPAGGAA